ncbi:hypothetical protein D7Y13_36200 [Corallococcus praedator]|uniref:Uncharacterized protein n=2 Tax=Myxococcaceae TaxID=31 RepID=A0ABX9Q6B1_9BACT|nr:hypothetical protein D7X74_37855 [Corallococcus sp. CA047B]RKH20094.1 hypothetical protein D7X75_38160 [Corallococcus sp. CA031C]RKH92569.1 hypothetical protein D7Y13_36200 [Corallococcus praedator]
MVLFIGCMRRQGASSESSRVEDPSIVFPDFSSRVALSTDAPGQVYALDGALLRAGVLAADAFLPREHEGRSCWNRRESYRFRILREGDIAFVRIDADPRACTPGVRLLDGGATYAVRISEGRILRSLHDGEPDGTRAPGSPDAGAPDAPATSIPVGDTSWGEPLPDLPSQWLDAGTRAPPVPSP